MQLCENYIKYAFEHPANTTLLLSLNAGVLFLSIKYCINLFNKKITYLNLFFLILFKNK